MQQQTINNKQVVINKQQTNNPVLRTQAHNTHQDQQNNLKRSKYETRGTPGVLTISLDNQFLNKKLKYFHWSLFPSS